MDSVAFYCLSSVASSFSFLNLSLIDRRGRTTAAWAAEMINDCTSYIALPLLPESLDKNDT